MKKITMLFIALLAGIAILWMVYQQRQKAVLSEKMAMMPENIAQAVDEARVDIAQETTEKDMEKEAAIDNQMTHIEQDYKKSTGKEMPDDVYGEIRKELKESGEEK